LATLDLGPDREHWETTRDGVLATLDALRPDVIALQDVLQTPELPNQACWLAGRLGYSCHFITADPPSRPRREGNALLTRRRIIEDAVTVLHPYQLATTAGLLRLDIDGTAVNVYVTQLSRGDGDDPTLRTRQVHNLLRWIEATAEEAPSIVAGDLGAAGDAQDLAELTAAYRDDAASGGSPPSGTDTASSALVLPGPA
ncbi:endonuclease/exonuclease/phosphatase family protein, partial [Xanthomonas sp. Kuri4-2]